MLYLFVDHRVFHHCIKEALHCGRGRWIFPIILHVGFNISVDCRTIVFKDGWKPALFGNEASYTALPTQSEV